MSTIARRYMELSEQGVILQTPAPPASRVGSLMVCAIWCAVLLLAAVQF